MMTLGLTSWKACAMMAGDGRRVRKNRWHPWQKLKMNSKAMPYIWAMGRMESMLSPAFTYCESRRMQNSRLPQSER